MSCQGFGVSNSEVEFWNHLIAKPSLLAAIAANRPAANRFFGEPAVARGNVGELVQIAFARRVLSMSDEALVLEIEQTDSGIEALIQRPKMDTGQMKCTGGFVALQEPSSGGEQPATVSIFDIWSTTAQDVVFGNTSPQSEVCLMRGIARRLIEKTGGDPHQ